jgi:hypothetical protein
MTPDSLPIEMEVRLTHLLGQWANSHRLSAARASRIREAIQEDDAWEQAFWARMSAVLTPAPAVVAHVPAHPWSLALPVEADLEGIAAQSSFTVPDARPYLCVSI